MSVSPTYLAVETADVRPPISGTFVLWLMVCLYPGTTAAQRTGILPKHHAWGRFKPGAWKLVCVVTETFDEKGLVTSTSTTETRTTLMQVDAEGVTLELEVVHEVAGKQFAAEPRTVRQGFHGELICQNLKVNESRPGQVVIEGRKIPCRTVQLECSAPTSKTVTQVYYSDVVAPYLLKRHSVTSDLDGNNMLSETTADVVGLEMPSKARPKIRRMALIKTVNKHAKGTVVTWTYTSPAVPGGVIGHDSRELDKDGRLIRRSRLQLIGYGSAPEREWIGRFGRKRALRPRKPKSGIRYVPR